MPHETGSDPQPTAKVQPPDQENVVAAQVGRRYGEAGPVGASAGGAVLEHAMALDCAGVSRCRSTFWSAVKTRAYRLRPRPALWVPREESGAGPTHCSVGVQPHKQCLAVGRRDRGMGQQSSDGVGIALPGLQLPENPLLRLQVLRHSEGDQVVQGQLLVAVGLDQGRGDGRQSQPIEAAGRC